MPYQCLAELSCIVFRAHIMKGRMTCYRVRRPGNSAPRVYALTSFGQLVALMSTIEDLACTDNWFFGQIYL